ncbi:hypothetical protein OAT84_00450 [Gammaproteobacteria bacterium]|nr:hypothetical protein [Gammaproteobacteria bacterium]
MINFATVLLMVIGGFYVCLSPIIPQMQWFDGHLILLEQLSRLFEAIVYVLASIALVKYIQSD